MQKKQRAERLCPAQAHQAHLLHRNSAHAFAQIRTPILPARPAALDLVLRALVGLALSAGPFVERVQSGRCEVG